MALFVPQGTVVAAPVTLGSNSDLYPSHVANLGKGGLVTFDTIADRDSIPLDRREHLMEVTVLVADVAKKYRLKVANWESLSANDKNIQLVNNLNWVDVTSTGGSSITQPRILYVDEDTSYTGSGVPGDITKPYKVINDAITAASPGDKVKVLSNIVTSRLDLKNYVNIDADGFRIEINSDVDSKAIVASTPVNCTIVASSIVHNNLITATVNGATISVNSDSNINIISDIGTLGDKTSAFVTTGGSGSGSINIYGNVSSRYVAINSEVKSLNIYGDVIIVDDIPGTTTNVPPIHYAGESLNIFGSLRIERSEARDIEVNNISGPTYMSIHGDYILKNSLNADKLTYKTGVHVYGKTVSYNSPFVNYQRSKFLGGVEYINDGTPSTVGSSIFKDGFFNFITGGIKLENVVPTTNYFSVFSTEFGSIIEGRIDFELTSTTPDNGTDFTVFLNCSEIKADVVVDTFSGKLFPLNGVYGSDVKIDISGTTAFIDTLIADASYSKVEALILSDSLSIAIPSVGLTGFIRDCNTLNLSGSLYIPYVSNGAVLFNNLLFSRFGDLYIENGDLTNEWTVFGATSGSVSIVGNTQIKGLTIASGDLNQLTGSGFFKINNDSRIPDFTTINQYLGTDASGNLELKAGSGGGDTSPLTTKGDLYTYDTDNTRLPVGADNSFLIADSAEPTGLKWATGSSNVYATTLLDTGWQLFSGDIYYQDVPHNLNTEDVGVEVYDNTSKETVIPYKIDRISLDTVRIFVEGNTDTLRTVVFDAIGLQVSGGGIPEAPNDGQQYGRQNEGWTVITGGGAATSWGTIIGTLSNQTDLQSALDGKKADFTENTAFNKNFGTLANDVCEGNDVRLSGTVTTHSDVSDAGSGAIITNAERTTLGTALQPLDNVSSLTNDAGYLTSFTETDPVFSASEASNFVAGDKANLDNQSGTNTGDEVQATQTVSGIAEVSTVAEIDAGTDDTRMITPLGLANSQIQSKADTAVQPGDNVSTLTNDAGYLTATTAGLSEYLSLVDTNTSSSTAELGTDTPLVITNYSINRNPGDIYKVTYNFIAGTSSANGTVIVRLLQDGNPLATEFRVQPKDAANRYYGTIETEVTANIIGDINIQADLSVANNSYVGSVYYEYLSLQKVN